MATCAATGDLLQPSYPLTPVERMLTGAGQCPQRRDTTPVLTRPSIPAAPGLLPLRFAGASAAAAAASASALPARGCGPNVTPFRTAARGSWPEPTRLPVPCCGGDGDLACVLCPNQPHALVASHRLVPTRLHPPGGIGDCSGSNHIKVG